MEQSLGEEAPRGINPIWGMQRLPLRSFLSYPSRGAAADILGHVRLIQRRLSARMSVDEPPTCMAGHPSGATAC